MIAVGPEQASSPLAPELESASPSAPAPNPYAGDLFTRRYMTGDWDGWRTNLAERGVTMDFFATQFYQGVTSGGLSQEFEYGGKLDFLPNFDGQKLGLWQGLSANMHVETRFGTDTNVIDGTLLPSNAAMAFPITGEPTGTWITALRFNQALSENFVVFAGKVNTLDGYALKYSPGVDTNLPGLGGFQTMGLVFNPIAARGVPYSAAAAGAVMLFGQGSTLSVSVMDPEERSDRGMDNLFANGATFATDLVLRGKTFGLPSILDMGVVYTTSDFTTLDRSVYLNLLNRGQLQTGNLPIENSSWAVYVSGSQALWQSATDEKATWGLFGGLGLSDGNPNPIRYYASCGFGGRSMLPSRPLDSHGIGYYYLGLSDQVKDLTRNKLPLRDEYGVELFYNIAVTPYCRLTPNLEVARPAIVGIDAPIIAGLRLQMIL
ncbi:MAG: carbohydrate porin [Planctomycetaceae bacterium]|jgi:porin